MLLVNLLKKTLNTHFYQQHFIKWTFKPICAQIIKNTQLTDINVCQRYELVTGHIQMTH